MHETARCFGYPSDSTRTARERAREATCGHRRPLPGLVRAGARPPPRRVRLHRPAPWLNSSLRCPAPLWLNSSPRCHSPLWLNSGRRRALPTSHWSWVSSRAACRRAGSPARITTVVLAGVQWGGSGWRLRAWIADCTMHLGGPATVGAGPLMGADSWAVTLWRIASAARLRRSREHRAERGLPSPSARHHCGCSLGRVGIRTGPGRAGPAERGRGPAKNRPGAHTTHPASGPPATHLGQWPAHLRQAAPAPEPPQDPIISDGTEPGSAQPGTQAASLEVITVGVHSGHDLPCSRGKCPSGASRTAGLAPFPVKPCIRCKRVLILALFPSVQFGQQRFAAHPCRDPAPSSTTFPIILQPC
jgi:hypothetical protein